MKGHPLDSTRSNAFTMVELLIVMGIISLLMGILLPVVVHARRQAKMVNELAASHELMTAYISYAVDHQGTLMPGYINSSKRPDLVVLDPRGNDLGPLAVDRWPWRLMAYIRYGLKGTILVNDMTALLDPGGYDPAQWYEAPTWAYAVSLFPSLGLNYYNVGGDLNMPSYNEPGYIRKITEAKQPSRLIVFASARHAGGIEGHFLIFSSAYWQNIKNYSASDPRYWGYIAPRWNGKAIVACLDGHSELLSMRQLCDMTRWSNAAAIAGDKNMSRAAGDPNRVP